MRDKVRDIERLEHMLRAINVLIDYKDGHTLEEAQADPIVYFGLVKHVEIIGEAVKNLSENFRNKYPHIPFKQIAGMRDKLIHDYFGVDYEIVWKTIKDKLPQFSDDIMMLINNMTK